MRDNAVAPTPTWEIRACGNIGLLARVGAFNICPSMPGGSGARDTGEANSRLRVASRVPISQAERFPRGPPHSIVTRIVQHEGAHFGKMGVAVSEAQILRLLAERIKACARRGLDSRTACGARGHAAQLLGDLELGRRNPSVRTLVKCQRVWHCRSRAFRGSREGRKRENELTLTRAHG